MSPELISLVSYFLDGCANLCKTIVIPGNHDFNASNPNRLDALSPIIDNLKNENLIYFKHSGTMVVGNVAFHHYSIMGSVHEWKSIEPKKVKTKSRGSKTKVDVNIGLYHGQVIGSNTESGFGEFSDVISTSVFRGNDIVLLGDIHRKQYLDEAMRIAYPGSLIQQGFEEELTHGFLHWNLETLSSQFVPVDNDYAFHVLEVDNGQVVSGDIGDNSAPNVRVKIKYKNTDKDDLKKIIDDVAYSYDTRDIKSVNLDQKKFNSDLDADSVLYVRDVEKQIELIREFLLDQDIPSELWDRIIKINRDINTRVNISGKYSEWNVLWKPLEFTFSNMFSYGKDNYINFNDLHGSIGIFAPNASGKSTLLDSIVYCIFDKCSRTNKASQVLNNKSTEFHCKFKFELSGKIYVIERRGTKKRNGSVKVDVDFYELVDGEPFSLNGKRRDETNGIIRGFLGTYDDFILTTMSTQNDNRSFINMTKKERQELLYKFLDIYFFIDLYNIAKEDSRDVERELSKLRGINFDEHITNANDSLNDVSLLIEDKEKELREYTDLIEGYTDEIEELIQSKVTIEEVDIDYIFREIKMLNDQIDRDSTDLISKKESLQAKMKEYESVSEMLPVMEKSLSHIESEQVQLNLRKKNLDSFKTRLKFIENEEKRLNKNLESVKDHKYDPNCKYCVEHPIVKDIKWINDQLQSYKIERDDILERMTGMKTVEQDLIEINKKYEFCQDTILNGNRLSGEIERLESSLDMQQQLLNSKKEKLSGLERQVEVHNRNKDNIIHNRKVDDAVNGLKLSRSKMRIQLEGLQEDINDLIKESVKYKNKLDEVERQEAEYYDLVDRYSAYDYYMRATNRDGIPYMILKQVLPVIESEVNEVLDGMVDFTFSLQIGDNDAIEGYINYGDEVWSMELISGMERFILSLAIRSSLINLSGLPKPNFMSIDEGFGVLDGDHLNSVDILFSILKNNFKFILCISHLSVLRDYVDGTINIDKVDGYSKIQIL